MEHRQKEEAPVAPGRPDGHVREQGGSDEGGRVVAVGVERSRRIQDVLWM